MGHTWNPRVCEAGQWKLQVQGQPGLAGEIVSNKIMLKKKKERKC